MLRKSLFVLSFLQLVLAVPVKSQVIDTSGMLFRIAGEGTAVVERVPMMRSCMVHSTLMWQEGSYTVGAIGRHAFYCNYQLRVVSIPSSVVEIYSEAFYQCSSLRHIYVEGAVPPVCDEKSFMGVDRRKCVLHVPYGSLQAYKRSAGWGEFKKIRERKKR